MRASRHRPKGPDGLWKQGQRVPFAGWWIDQFGRLIEFAAHRTFPPSGRKGEVTYWESCDKAA